MNATERDTEKFCRRLACQIASQLPDDQRDALRTLRLVQQIIMNLGTRWDLAFNEVSSLDQYRSSRAASGEDSTEGRPVHLCKSSPE